MASRLYLSCFSGTQVSDFFGRTFLTMGLTELVLLSFGLASDAFSVSVCKGLSMKKIDRRGAVTTALFFGFFQFLMPITGFCWEFASRRI